MNNLLDNYQTLATASLTDAHSLPFGVYHDETVYRQEIDSIFRSDWVFVCFEQELPEAGDFFAFSLGGESLAVVRGADGGLRALSNNCRHRGTPLLDDGFGN
ncbi:MAG: Rieske 2Fe-2S domain-containing protein, partial [Pseudomonadota bacterium]